MSFLDKVKNLFTDEVEEEPVKSEVIQVEIPAPVKEEKEEKIEEDITDNNIVKNEEKVSTPIFFDDDYFKELDQPKTDRFNSYKEQTKAKEAPKHFKPTPIISPVYGVLDKNYSKEDITTKPKEVEKTNTSITLDEVRKKAYGTLEDDLENTMFSSNSILFNDEIKEDDDLFDELIDIEDDAKHAPKEEVKEDKTSDGELFDLIDSMYEKGE